MSAVLPNYVYVLQVRHDEDHILVAVLKHSPDHNERQNRFRDHLKRVFPKMTEQARCAWVNRLTPNDYKVTTMDLHP